MRRQTHRRGPTGPDRRSAARGAAPDPGVVGGGGGDFTDDGTLYYSAPDAGDAWIVVSSTATLTDANAANVEAYARCWNPHANVASTMLRSQSSAQHTVSPLGRRAIEKAAAKN